MDILYLIILTIISLLVVYYFIIKYAHFMFNHLYTNVIKDVDFIINYGIAPKEWQPFLLKLMGIESISKKFLMYKLLKIFKTYKSLKVNSRNKDKEIDLKKLIEIIDDWKVSNYKKIYPYS